MKKFLSLLILSVFVLTTVAFAAETAAADSDMEEPSAFGDVSVIDKTKLLKNPDAEITAKELCVYSARLCAFLNNDIDSMPNDKTQFFDVKSYLLANGVDAEVDLSDANRLVTLKDVILILGCIVNDEIIDVTRNEAFSIPDADITQEYYDYALNFLKAGIIEGTDVYGSVGVTNNVKLCDFVNIIDRILNEQSRVKKDYLLYASDEPFHLIENNSMASFGNVASGWKFDYTGSVVKGTEDAFNKVLTDLSTTDGLKISRKVFTQSDGFIVFEADFTYSFGFEGLNIVFRDSDGEEFFSVGTLKNNYFYYGKVTNRYYISKTNRETTKNGPIRVRIELDLDNKKASFYVTGRQVCKNYYLGDVKNLDSVEFLTGDAERLEVTVNHVYMYKNYAVNDLFRVEKQGQLPLGYSTGGSVTVEDIKSQYSGDNTSVKIQASEGVDSFASKTFKQTDGKVVAETHILLPDGNDGAYFTLSSAGVPVITVTTKNNAFYYKDKKLIDFRNNVWQVIRFEADTAAQTVTIRIRGKTVAENLPFLVKAKYFDSLTVGIVPDSDCVMWFDDVEVFETYDRADYVPVPEPVASEDYIVGMSVCNLWREGSHYGWSYIHPYHEPITGFYDEGIPEAMDWEIKFLAEHGFDFYNFCWYAHSGQPTAPLKKSGFNDSIHDGYFNAKYSDMLKISLMYENSSMYHTGTLDDFWEYIWPYWVDYYFTDDRYFEIEEDGKKYTFLTIYRYMYFVMMCNDEKVAENINGSYTFISDKKEMALANAAKVLKQMNDYLVDNGISDGLIVCFNDRGDRSETNKNIQKLSAEIGRDKLGIFPYTWGTSACELNTQKAFIDNAYNVSQSDGLDLLALACIGFNRIGWYHETKYPLISNDDLASLLKWIKSDYLPRYSEDSASWKQKFVQFATWNEYGEGHYFYPSNDNGGYDYLDTMAKELSGVSDSSENNLIPTESQKARLRHLYVGDRMHIRRNFDEEFLENEMSITDPFMQWQWDVGNPVTTKNTSMFKGFTLSGVKESYVKGSECVSQDPNHFCVYGGCVYEIYFNGVLTTTNVDPMMYKKTPGKAIIKAEDADVLSITLSCSIPYSSAEVFFISEDESIQDFAIASDGTRNFTQKYSYSFDILSTETVTYNISLASNKGWIGDISGIRFDFGSYKNAEVKLYDVTFHKINEAKKKPSIMVDGMKYSPVDFGEIRSADKNEFYIAPAESEGLYKMLHIVYDWHKDTQKLVFETPNDVTFEFNVGSDRVKVNSREEALEKKIELYDGVPVIPLLWILDKAGYDYVYDYTNKLIDITVADVITKYCDVENGDAQGYNTEAFFSEDNYVDVSVATDTENAKNKVWLVTGKTNRRSSIATSFDWENGTSYVIDFDARLVSTQKDGVDLYFNAVFADTETSKTDHTDTQNKFVLTDEWTHYTITYTTPETLYESDDIAEVLCFFADVDILNTVSFMFDNLKVRTKPKVFPLVNGDFEDEDASMWFSGSSELSVEEENGNRYMHAGVDKSISKWIYLRQKTTFEPGMTYYFSVDVRLGTGHDGSNVATAVILNARYNDLLRQNAATNVYDHTFTLGGSNHTLKTSDTWTTYKGYFTISNGYTPGGINGGYDEITFFSNPVNGSSVAVEFDIDNFIVSVNYDDIFGDE